MPNDQWLFTDSNNQYRHMGFAGEDGIQISSPDSINGHEVTGSYIHLMREPMYGTFVVSPDLIWDLLCQGLADRPIKGDVRYRYRVQSIQSVRYAHVWQYRLERKGNRGNRRGSKKHLRHVPIAMRDVVLRNATITGVYQPMSDSVEPAPITVSFECEGIDYEDEQNVICINRL